MIGPIQRWMHRVEFFGVSETTQLEEIKTRFRALTNEFGRAVVSASVTHEGQLATCTLVGLYDEAVLRQVTRRISAFGHDEHLAPGDVIVNANPLDWAEAW
jgi:phage gp45-like